MKTTYEQKLNHLLKTKDMLNTYYSNKIGKIKKSASQAY